MEPGLENELQEIMGGEMCPKDFECYKDAFSNPCQVIEHSGLKDYVQCLKRPPLGCTLSMLFGTLHLCRCPLRVFICKQLGKTNWGSYRKH
jgi:hypothetical protein